MNRYVYKGDAEDQKTGGRNLSRFGFVKPGDVIILTPKETLCILGDPRFEAWDETKHDTAPDAEGSSETAAELETIRQMTPESLRELAKEMRLTVPRHAKPDRVLAIILAAKTGQATNPAPE